jgi:hypothetical protein
MFEPTSRYSQLPTKKLETVDRREIAYVLRRFLPSGKELPLLVDVTVNQGDRLDIIAARTIGDPEQFWRICDANDAMNPFDLEEVDLVLHVPVPTVIE